MISMILLIMTVKVRYVTSTLVGPRNSKGTDLKIYTSLILICAKSACQTNVIYNLV